MCGFWRSLLKKHRFRRTLQISNEIGENIIKFLKKFSNVKEKTLQAPDKTRDVFYIFYIKM